MQRCKQGGSVSTAKEQDISRVERVLVLGWQLLPSKQQQAIGRAVVVSVRVLSALAQGK